MLAKLTCMWVSRICDLDRVVAFMRETAGVRSLKALLVSAIILVMPSPAAAHDIYKYKDEKGQWKYSNAPSPPEQRETIAPLPRSAGDCTPFTIGEARELKSSPSWSSYPNLQILGLQVKLVDVSYQLTRFSWRMQIRNISSRQESVFGDVNFLDCSGFLLGRVSMNRTSIAAGHTIEMSGQGSVWGKMAHSVGRFSVELSGTSLPKPPVQLNSPLPPLRIAPPHPAQFARVGLRWSRLAGVVGDSYVSGEVENTGPSRANDVRVRISVLTPQGAIATTGTVEVNPSTLAPGAGGSFRQRVTIPAIEGFSTKVEPEWSSQSVTPGYGLLR